MHWNNTWFLNSVDFCDDRIDSLVLQTRKSEEQNTGVGLHTIVDENKDTPSDYWYSWFNKNSRTNFDRHASFTNYQCDFTREKASVP